MFLVFVGINSLGILPPEIRTALVEASRWGLLIAIAALGFGTSLGTILRIGPRHLLVIVSTTLVIFALPLAWLVVAG